MLYAVMLTWFVDNHTAAAALDGNVIEETSVETSPIRVSSACLDDSVVELKAIQQYFTVDAWAAVQQVVAVKRQQQVWPCPSCSQNATDAAICCDSCLLWWHCKCAGIKAEHVKKDWFCAACKNASR